MFIHIVVFSALCILIFVNLALIQPGFAANGGNIFSFLSHIFPSTSSHVTADNGSKKQVLAVSDAIAAASGLSSDTSPTNNTNLLHNSSFEVETNGQPRDWNYQLDSTTGNTFISQEGNRSGKFGLKFVGGSTGNLGISQPNVKTIPQRTYTISLYVKSTNAAKNAILHFGFWNEYLNKEGAMKTISLVGTRDWTRYIFTITTPGVITDLTNEFPLIEVEGLTAGAVYLDDAQLVEGNTAVVYNSSQAYPSAYGIGDGSIIFSTGGNIYPAIDGKGSIGSSTNKFESLTLSNASIDKDGNINTNGGLTVNGNSEIKGALTVDSTLTVKAGTTISFGSFGAGVLHSNSSGTVTSSAVDLTSSDVTGALAVSNGGTGTTNLTQYGILYGNGTSALTALTPGTSGYVLQSNGTGAAPSWIAASSGSSFSALTTGTNSSATMTVGSGATLQYGGSGVLNANQLLGGTWAIPGAIGSTTTNTGAFTTLSGSGTITFSGLSTGIGHLNSSGVLTSSAVNLSNSDVTGVLSLSNGGTNANLTAVNGGIVYSGGSALAISSAGTTGNCLLSGGAGTPTWGNCATGTNLWTSTNGALYPVNSTMDLFVGGTATSSAKFGFLNVNSGTPTASISAGTAGLSLAGDGTIQSVRNSTLTIGGGNTGNIVLAPLNYTGNVGINTATPTQSLDVANTLRVRDYAEAANGLALNAYYNSGWKYRSTNSAFSINTNFNSNKLSFDYAASGTADSAVSFTDGIVLDATSGNVGIGTNDPSTGKLQVSGGDIVDFNNGSNPRFVIGDNGTSGQYGYLQWDSSNDYFRIEKNGTNGMKINDNYVSIGNIFPSQPLIVGNGSTELLRVNTLGQVGINASSPLATFDLRTISGTQPTASISGATSYAGLVVDNSGKGDIFTASSSGLNRFVITQNGNVGIGTNNPGSKLEVNGAVSSTGGFSVTGSGALSGSTGGIDNAFGVVRLYSNLSNSDLQLVSVNGATHFYNGGTERMTILSGGNVGIGTSNPQQELQISSGNLSLDNAQSLYLDGPTDTAWKIGREGPNPTGAQLLTTAAIVATIQNNTGNQGFMIRNASGTSLFELQGSNGQTYLNGNLGIGTVNPLSTLDVRANSGTLAIASISGKTSLAGLIVDNSGVGDVFTASSSGLNRFVITQGGNVGIGTTAPTRTLDIVGTASDTSNGISSQISVRGPGSTIDKLNIGYDTTNGYGYIESVQENVFWRSLALQPMGGNVGIGYNGPANKLDVNGSMAVGTYRGTTGPTNGLIISGNVGIGTTSPLAKLDVRSTTGTVPTASISGASSFAGLVVDNSGTGDLFTASSSGLNRFVITQNGNVGIGNTVPVEALQISAGNILLDNAQGYKIKDSGGTARQVLFMTSGNNLQMLNSASTGQTQVGINNGSNTSAVIFTTKNNQERMRIDQNGNVGIGALVPLYKLDLIATQSATTSASITNLTTTDSNTNSALTLNLGTSVTGTSSRFIKFFAGANTSSNAIGVGNISLNNNAVAYNTSGADFAEYFPKGSTPLTQGDIVALDSDGKAVPATEKTGAIGILSTTAGFVGNIPHDDAQTANNVVVGLVGQLPVKVTTENGTIHPGDMLTFSSVPGVAMKATKSGIVIGRAIEGYTNSNTQTVGKIVTLVNVTYYDPSVQIATNGDLQVGGQVLGTNTIVSPSILPDQFTHLSDTVTDLQNQIASLSATVAKFTDLSKELADMNKTGSTSSGLQSEDTTIAGKLTVAGKTVLSDVGITGTLNMGLLTVDGLDTSNATSAATINTLSGPLKLQSLALNGIDLVDGKIKIDTDGSMTLSGTVSAKTVRADTFEANDSGDNPSVGEAVISTGKVSTEVKTSALTEKSHIFVEPEDIPVTTAVKKTSLDTFLIKIPQIQSSDVKFHWWIVN